MNAPLLPALPGYDDPQLIAHGTTALVFRAMQTRLNRPVAIKVITLDTGSTPINAERELATTVALSSQPHIVSIIDTGVTEDDRPYIVMEYCEGGSYAQILRQKGPLPIAEVLEVGTNIGEALHAAHQVGIIHRDVKPSNILRSRFGPALTDFGIARAPDELGNTLTREMMTPHHASPEALLHQAQSGPSDVYSLASTMWTLLVGHPPFVDPRRPAMDMYAFRDRVLHERLPTMERDDVPAWLIGELTRAMSKLPSQRHSTALDFVERLRRGMLDLSIPAAPAAAPVPSGSSPAAGPPGRPTGVARPAGAGSGVVPAGGALAGAARGDGPASPAASAQGGDGRPVGGVRRPPPPVPDQPRDRVHVPGMPASAWPADTGPPPATAAATPAPTSAPPVLTSPAPIAFVPPVGRASVGRPSEDVSIYVPEPRAPVDLPAPPGAWPEPAPPGTRPEPIPAGAQPEPVEDGGWLGPAPSPSWHHEAAAPIERSPTRRFDETDLYPPSARRRGGFIAVLVGLAVLAIGAAAALVLTQPNGSPRPPVSGASATPQPTQFITAKASGAPTSVQIVEQRPTQVSLKWTDPSGGIASFIIAGTGPAGERLASKTVERGVVTVTFTGLSPTKNYCFVVGAVYAVNNVAAAQQVCTVR